MYYKRLNLSTKIARRVETSQQRNKLLSRYNRNTNTTTSPSNTPHLHVFKNSCCKNVLIALLASVAEHPRIAFPPSPQQTAATSVSKCLRSILSTPRLAASHHSSSWSTSQGVCTLNFSAWKHLNETWRQNTHWSCRWSVDSST